jgi:hypothetical protein
LGAASATALVGRVVGLFLGGQVGGLLVIPLGLTPGLCLGVSGPPIGPLWVTPFDGLLKPGLVVGFDAVTGTSSGRRFAFAVGRGALWASCGEGRSLLIGHAGQIFNHRAFCAGGRPSLGRGSHLACPDSRFHGLNVVGHAGQTVNQRAFRAGSRPIPGCGGHSACSGGRFRGLNALVASRVAIRLSRGGCNCVVVAREGRDEHAVS